MANLSEWKMSNSSISFTQQPIQFSIIDVTIMALSTSTFVLGVCGNALVMYVFGYMRGKQRSRFESFLLLLAVNDLISSIIIPSTFFYLTATAFRSWHFGTVGCKVIPSLLHVSVTISQGILILISYERYRAIVHPFKRKVPHWQVSLGIILTVLLSVVFAAPYIHLLKIFRNDDYNVETCLPGGKNGILMLSATFTLVRDIMAIFLMTYLGYRMNHTLTRTFTNSTLNRAQFTSRGRKLLKVVITVFCLLTLPLDIFKVGVYSIIMAQVYIPETVYKYIIIGNTFLNILQASNSVVNVFIYSKMHSFKENLTCRRKKNKWSMSRECKRIYRTTSRTISSHTVKSQL